MFSRSSLEEGKATCLITCNINVFPTVVLQAVDVVGQAGKPKTITGFQTHTTPVLLAYGERAELATEECILCVCLITNCQSVIEVNCLIAC